MHVLAFRWLVGLIVKQFALNGLDTRYSFSHDVLLSESAFPDRSSIKSRGENGEKFKRKRKEKNEKNPRSPIEKKEAIVEALRSEPDGPPVPEVVDDQILSSTLNEKA